MSSKADQLARNTNHLCRYLECENEVQKRGNKCGKWDCKKKKPQKLQSTELFLGNKKNKDYLCKGITKQTPKEAAAKRKYGKMLSKKLEEHGRKGCEGCGMQKPLDPSHIIAISKRKDLQSDPDNVHLQCRKCHVEIFELGKLYLLNDGLRAFEYIFRNDTEEFNRLYWKFEGNQKLFQQSHYFLFFKSQL